MVDRKHCTMYRSEQFSSTDGTLQLTKELANPQLMVTERQFHSNWRNIVTLVVSRLETRANGNLLNLDLIGASLGSILVLYAAAHECCFGAFLAIDWLYDMQQLLAA
jgi:hypothetical protein